MTATLSFCVGGVPTNNTITTDPSGYFTLTITLPNGTYNWRLKGSRWLASSGSVSLFGGTTNVEMGTQRAGDANDNNTSNAQDFTILRNTFGQPGPQDPRADFDNDGAVTISDFFLLRSKLRRKRPTPHLPLTPNPRSPSIPNPHNHPKTQNP